MNKLATAILKKFYLWFSTHPVPGSHSQRPSGVTRSQWQCPPVHQEPVTTPPGSPGASDNDLQVTRSQWQRPPGHQEPASRPQATRTQCIRPRATRSHWERPQTTESQRPYHRVARCSVNASGPPRGKGHGHCRFSPLQTSCSRLITFSPLLLLFPSSTVELILSLKLNPSLNSSLELNLSLKLKKEKEKKKVDFEVSNLNHHLNNSWCS